MGCVLSTGAVDGGVDNIEEIIISLSSYYDEACRLDPSLRSFDISLRRRTEEVVSTLAADADNAQSISLHSLQEAADGLADVGSDASVAILELRDEIKSNPDLICFVCEYFRRSVDILKFFAAIRECLRGARKMEAIAVDAIDRVDDGNFAGASEKLNAFIAAGDPFTRTFFQEIEVVREQQRRLLKALRKKKRELDQKLRNSKSWRKVWSVVFAVALATALIFSVVLAAVSAPPAATAAAAALSAAAVPLKEWVESLLNACELRIKEKKAVVNKLENGASIIHELDDIKLVAKRVEIHIEGMLNCAELGITEEEEAASAAMRAAVVEIKAKIAGFTRSVEQLEKEVERCRKQLRQATAAIVRAVKDEDEDL